MIPHTFLSNVSAYYDSHIHTYIKISIFVSIFIYISNCILFLFYFWQIGGAGPGLNPTLGGKSPSNPKSSRKSTPPVLEMAFLISNNGM